MSFRVCIFSLSLYSYVIFLFYYYVTSIAVVLFVFFFLMIRRPPRSTLDRSSAASDVYKRQRLNYAAVIFIMSQKELITLPRMPYLTTCGKRSMTVSYTHLRAHETVLDLVCRLLLEKTKHHIINSLLT